MNEPLYRYSHIRPYGELYQVEFLVPELERAPFVQWLKNFLKPQLPYCARYFHNDEHDRLLWSFTLVFDEQRVIELKLLGLQQR